MHTVWSIHDRGASCRAHCTWFCLSSPLAGGSLRRCGWIKARLGHMPKHLLCHACWSQSTGSQDGAARGHTTRRRCIYTGLFPQWLPSGECIWRIMQAMRSRHRQLCGPPIVLPEARWSHGVKAWARSPSVDVRACRLASTLHGAFWTSAAIPHLVEFVPHTTQTCGAQHLQYPPTWLDCSMHLGHIQTPCAA